MLLENKIAVVTGASQGIGAAVALELAREGADVCLNYYLPELKPDADRYVDEIVKMGRRAIAVQGDVSLFKDAEKVVAQAVEKLGGLHILVNNAGINWDGVSWKMKEEQWDRVLAVNLKGYFNFTRHAAPVFKEQK